MFPPFKKITKQLPIVELLEFDFKVVNYAIQQFEENVLLLHITLMLSLYERFSCQFSEIKEWYTYWNSLSLFFTRDMILQRVFPSLSESFWAFPSLSEPFQAFPSLSEPSRAYPSLPEPSRAFPSLPEPSRVFPSLPEPSRALSSLSKPFRVYLSQFNTIWVNLILFKPI